MIRRSSFAFLSAALLLGSALDPARAGNVLVVDAGGGGSFTQIQPAVDAAVDGDTILVKTGTYPGFRIDDKSLSVVVDSSASVSVGQSVAVNDLGASRSVLLAGFQIQGNSYGAALLAQNDRGSLRVEDCTLVAMSNGLCSSPLAGALLVNDLDAAFCRCTIRGAPGIEGNYSQGCEGGHGLQAQSSSVALYDCIVQGGDGGIGYDTGCDCSHDGGPGGSGGDGISFTAPGFVFASNTNIEGGSGGDGGYGCTVFCDCNGPGNGGPGGVGFHASNGSAPYPWFVYLDSTVSGGAGGYGRNYDIGDLCVEQSGNGSHGSSILAPSGSTSALPGSARQFSGPSVVRENHPFDLDFYGSQFDQVWLFIGQGPTFVYNAHYFGVNLTTVPPIARPLLLGPIPSNGHLTLQRTLPDFGIPSRTLYMQAVFNDTAGVRRLASPLTLVVLDPAY